MDIIIMDVVRVVNLMDSSKQQFVRTFTLQKLIDGHPT